LKNQKTKKFKNRYLIAAELIIVVILITLVGHRPGYYHRPTQADTNEVSTYLTNQLLPAVYNGAQYKEPFTITITEQGLAEIISHSSWPKKTKGSPLYAPAIHFLPGKIVALATVSSIGLDLIITAELTVSVGPDGLLGLGLEKVKVGALNTTLLARFIGRKIYQRKFTADDYPNNLQSKIAGALFSDKPFDPTFEIDSKKLRIKNITVDTARLSLHLAPTVD